MQGDLSKLTFRVHFVSRAYPLFRFISPFLQTFLPSPGGTLREGRASTRTTLSYIRKTVVLTDFIEILIQARGNYPSSDGRTQNTTQRTYIHQDI